MAIVKITNGKNTIEVSNGAFKSMYERLGFKIVGDKKPSKKNKEEIEPEELEEAEEAEVLDEEEDAIFLDAISDVPVSKWSKDDLAKYVKIKGIDTSAASNFGEAKKIVKEYIDKEA